MLDNLKNELDQLDALLAEFRSHPMYDEWKDIDEVTLITSPVQEEESLVDEEAYWIDQLENQG